MAHTYTWTKLAQNAYRLNPKSRGFKYSTVPKFEQQEFSSGPNRGKKAIIPYKGTNSLLIGLTAWGVTQSSLHKISLLFHDVEILTENPNSMNYFQLEYNGTMYWIHKLDRNKNPLTSRCSCFTGDTKILLADGTESTLFDLQGKEFDVLSYNQEADKFEKVHAFNCEKKRENTEVLRLTLDNGKSIDCTPDHKFLTRDGIWTKAEDLQIGQSLRAFYGTNLQNGLNRNINGGHEKVQEHKPEEKFYIYVYLDPRYPGEYNYKTCSFNYKPIYVGKGSRNRHLQHLNTDKTDHFHNTVRKLQYLGLEPIILKQKENLTEAVAYRMEKELTQEIGLFCENKGPLLNMKHGGEGGLSGVAKIHAQDHMINNNPMKDTKIAKKVRDKNIKNGVFENQSKRMQTNNPIQQQNIKEKQRNTYMTKYSTKYRSEIATKASHSRTEETFKKISETLKNNEIAKKVHSEAGKRVGQLAKKRAQEGTLHTQQPEWKDFCSQISKRNWNNPEIREKMMSNYRAKSKQLHDNTLTQLIDIVKKEGFVNLDLYVYKKGYNYSIYSLKQEKCKKYIQEEALEQAFINHKVINIEKIQNQDVYCLTTEYLGNFVVSTPDNDSNVISGVVVSNCADEFFTFALWKYNAGCLYGPKPKPYQRKTQHWPERNPGHIVGICKHVYHSWQVLKDSGFTLN